MIGLREEPSTRPWDAGRSAANHAYFRDRYGMPFSLTPKARPAATGRGCRAVVAARLDDPGSEWKVLRALYFANFTTPLLLDDDAMIRDALNAAGLDGDAIVARLDDADVAEAYERDRAEARSAGGHGRRGAGQDRHLGRACPLHGAVDHLRARRRAARRRRLAARDGLRRADREPGPGARAPRAAGDAARAARALPGRPDDRRGCRRPLPRAGLRREHGRRRGRAGEARRGRARSRASRSARTRSGSRPRPPRAVPKRPDAARA